MDRNVYELYGKVKGYIQIIFRVKCTMIGDGIATGNRFFIATGIIEVIGFLGLIFIKVLSAGLVWICAACLFCMVCLVFRISLRSHRHSQTV